MAFDSPALPESPISMLLLPVVRLIPALKPTAMLLEPVVLPCSALAPIPVLLLPNTPLKASAPEPTAVLLAPLVLFERVRSRGGLIGAGGVLLKCLKTIGCIAGTHSVARKSDQTCGGVVTASCV